MSFTQTSFISGLFTYLASTTSLKTTKFSLKSEEKKTNLHAHKKVIIVSVFMTEVYSDCQKKGMTPIKST